MSEIIEKPLREIGCGFLSGFAFKSSDYSSKGIPLIKIGNIQNRIVTVDINGDYVSEELINDKTIKFLLNNSDILIAMTGQGSVGRVGKLKLRNNEKAFLNQRVGKFLCDEIGINKDYLYYILTTVKYQDYLFNTGAGSGQPNLSPELILQTEIPWVEYNEQIAIASVLNSLDNKIDLLHRQNATLEKMAETLFRQWFVEEALEEWEEVELGKLIDVVIDNRGKTPPTVEFETGYPLIEVNALNSDSCLVDYTVIRKYVIKDTFDTWFRKHLKVNDIIISTVGTIGVFSIHLANKGCIAQNLVGLRSSRISSYFLYCFFKSNIETLVNLDIGGVQPSIKVPHLLGLSIKLPPNDLLNRFNESVEIYFNKIATNQTQIRTLTALRDTLLPKLMSGEIRVEMS
jgi:type I restriction enzyme S subunit